MSPLIDLPSPYANASSMPFPLKGILERRVAADIERYYGWPLSQAVGPLTTPEGQKRSSFPLLVFVDGAPSAICVVANEAFAKEVVEPADGDVRSDLERIKCGLGLSLTQMAQLFGVTRKTVYDWYEGVEPRNTAKSRVRALDALVNEKSAKVELKRLKYVWDIAVNGASFKDVLSTAEGGFEHIYDLVSAKIDEVSPLLVSRSAKKSPSANTRLHGNAHLAEFDRSSDFS